MADLMNRNMENKGKEKRLTKKQKQFLKVFAENVGNVSAACKKMGISRRTYYYWIENPKFLEEIDFIEEESIDFAESQLKMNIADRKEASIFFYLKTKGKKRGYIEQVETKEVGNPWIVLAENSLRNG